MPTRGKPVKKKTTEEMVVVRFRYPLAPQAERAKKDVISIPSKLLEQAFKLETGEFFFLQYLIKETYGEHKLELELSYSDLSNGARVLWGEMKGVKTFFNKKFTKPQVARALKKFEQLGFIRATLSSHDS